MCGSQQQHSVRAINRMSQLWLYYRSLSNISSKQLQHRITFMEHFYRQKEQKTRIKKFVEATMATHEKTL